MDNKLSSLTNYPLRYGRRDCYTLAGAARLMLGREPLPTYDNYIGKDHSAMILEAAQLYTPVSKPANGDIAVLQGRLEVILGTYCDGMVLLFNERRKSALIPVQTLDILAYYGDLKNPETNLRQGGGKAALSAAAGGSQREGGNSDQGIDR